MPELPEVETTKVSLEPLLDQKVLNVQVHNARLRWAIPNDISKLKGQKLIGLSRRSKYIFAQFEQDTMLWHLGMSGSFRLCQPSDERRKHDHLIIQFEDIELRYHDPRRFGCILWLNDDSQTKLIDTLGPEPLSDTFDADYLATKLKTKNTAIKVAIMDNHVVVGVGNIYATESLFNLGIHPAQPAKDLSKIQIEKLVIEIKRILKQAIDLGGSTLRDYSNAMGENGMFRILVEEDKTDKPWPSQLKIGTGVQGIALLNNVPVWYELWRNINGFPPDFYEMKTDSKIDKSAKKEK